MTPDDLDAIRYLPSIRSRRAELHGYRNLRAGTKQKLRPIVSLGKLGKVGDPQRILHSISESVGGEFFIDLNLVPSQMCDGFDGLCNPENKFAAWRELIEQQDNAIPVALLVKDDTPERQFVQQALEIETDYGVVAIRSRRPAADLASLQAAIGAVDDVNNVFVVLDFGYIRGSQEAKEQEALRVISSLRSIDPITRIAVMASSFPKAVSAYGELGGSLEILERDFHAHIGGDQVAIYADHAAIYPEPFEPSISRFVPRIDYCLDDAWIYRRRRTEQGGYVTCADELTELPDWDDEFVEKSWGAAVVLQTSEDDSVPTGFGSPANWIAARVNMHIERQTDVPAVPDDGEDEESE